MTLLTGDCIERMAEMPEASVDAVVCDPPYGLEFMGQDWDRLDTRQPDDPTFHRSGVGPFDRSKVRYSSSASYGGAVGPAMQAWHERWAVEAFRVLKPGGHLLAFGGTRTYHRLACAIEDAGFEIRDSIMWLYGSGFPKSLDVSKAIDKRAGAEREVVGQSSSQGMALRPGQSTYVNGSGEDRTTGTAPATTEAKQWDGWGTALKPAHEPIVVARKPLIGTVAENVLQHGTGGINIDACRIEGAEDTARPQGKDIRGGQWSGSGGKSDLVTGGGTGRHPANAVLSHLEDCNGNCAPGCPVAELDAQSGNLHGAGNVRPSKRGESGYEGGWSGEDSSRPAKLDGGGGASRFFYCAKTSRAERNAGLEGHPDRELRTMENDRGPGEYPGHDSPNGQTATRSANHHPTVKPINLMRWLVRMVTPRPGLVLDPFLGSGTTGCAAVLEGFDFIGIEREPEYVAIAEARIAFWAQHVGREVAEVLKAGAEANREAAAHRVRGQLSMEA